MRERSSSTARRAELQTAVSPSMVRAARQQNGGVWARQWRIETGRQGAILGGLFLCFGLRVWVLDLAGVLQELPCVLVFLRSLYCVCSIASSCLRVSKHSLQLCYCLALAVPVEFKAVSGDDALRVCFVGVASPVVIQGTNQTPGRCRSVCRSGNAPMRMCHWWGPTDNVTPPAWPAPFAGTLSTE